MGKPNIYGQNKPFIPNNRRGKPFRKGKGVKNGK